MKVAAESQEREARCTTRTLLRLRDADDLARTAAHLVAEAAREATSRRGRFTLALAGGDTPRRLYERLAADSALDWSHTEFFWGDERPVPPGHPESNFGMAQRTLLAPLGIDPKRIHRIEAERADLHAVASDYEARLTALADGTRETLPRLDLVLLGIGTDAHTASLFPYTEALAETRRSVVANEVPQLATRRVTITFPLIERARVLLVLVSGAAKAAMLAEILEGPSDPERLPAQRIGVREGRVDWLVDAQAASGLCATAQP